MTAPTTTDPATFEADGVTTIALTALTLAEVFSLGRLFPGHSYVGPVVTTAIAMHALAWGCRRYGMNAFTAATVSLGPLALLVARLVLPERTGYGLPLGSTWHAFRLALQEAKTDFHAVTAPAPFTRGFELVTVTAVGLRRMRRASHSYTSSKH